MFWEETFSVLYDCASHTVVRPCQNTAIMTFCEFLANHFSAILLYFAFRSFLKINLLTWEKTFRTREGISFKNCIRKCKRPMWPNLVRHWFPDDDFAYHVPSRTGGKHTSPTSEGKQLSWTAILQGAISWHLQKSRLPKKAKSVILITLGEMFVFARFEGKKTSERLLALRHIIIV